MLQESWAQPEVTICHLGEGFRSCGAQRYNVMHIPWAGTRSLLSLCYYFLRAPFLFMYSFTSLISNCLNLPFGTQDRFSRLKKGNTETKKSRNNNAEIKQGHGFFSRDT